MTIAEIEQRLSEVRSQIVNLEDNTSRYYELGDVRMGGYDNEEMYDELLAVEEELMDELTELEEALDDE